MSPQNPHRGFLQQCHLPVLSPGVNPGLQECCSVCIFLPLAQEGSFRPLFPSAIEEGMEILPAAEQEGWIFVFCGVSPEGLVPGGSCVSVPGEGSAGAGLTAARVAAEMGRQMNNLLRKKRTRTAKGPLRATEASRKAKLWKLFRCTGSETFPPARRQLL